ncbi:hypothetical protein SDC9_73745 [bioreactor metagenome]|uniref:Uncharacterized protein n=1 Tax=bioreactor metagenome TaxID=1076179 RepID=A0A644YF73_9ZZZZ
MEDKGKVLVLGLGGAGVRIVSALMIATISPSHRDS